MNLSGIGVWSAHLRWGDPAEAADAAAELDELGFEALWIPDVGGPVLDAVGALLAATKRATIATGILNLWMHDPADVAAGHAALTAQHGERFLMGIGVSHAPLIDAAEAGRYRRPLAAMTAFLDGLDKADTPVPADARVLAALGPKMLDLAGSRARGVHPYLVTPEHTALARERLGPGPLVLPEQTVILATDVDEARGIGRGWLAGYLKLPNYANNLRRLGFTDEELSEVSDRLFDAVIAWGDEEAVRRRVEEHRAAGADHVCLQVLLADQQEVPRAQWRRLATALL
ncbi:putative F420-dependent oxidoreductase, MSMEG_4141 family [Frankia sp. EI5c]|uniref:LLM class F420-dependent oxidoreductase n=1 Tax=Frankia sp. EI5c TaxID=683316 RepID=UPI0007C4069E|nr:LLM class F420-dependent oxidoreductase [Frankia sp. EI5c]OAA18936.1 putative F420-dependent oxidoreductase, MSMEG_4141 family [Frankia sp. EI5c]